MLKKFVMNDWVHVSSGLVLEDGGRTLKWRGDFCWDVHSNAKK